MKDSDIITECPGRREFLVRVVSMAGGLAIILSGSSLRAGAFEDVVIVIDDKSSLNKVGGSTIIDSSVGKIIVVRTGDAAFVAYLGKMHSQTNYRRV